MATKQDLQDRLRAEMLRELGQETDLAYSQIEALPFLDNFLRETLRVYASGKLMLFRPQFMNHDF